MKRKIGIVGYGHLGRFLVESIETHPDLELSFVWNRTPDALSDRINSRFILQHLGDFHERQCDLIVEVAHPCITEKYGTQFLKHCDFMIGSPSALANAEVERDLKNAATGHGLYVPSGAFWGGDDIRKMADRGTLKKLKVIMRKHPDSLKLKGNLSIANAQVKREPVTLYDGAVRELCYLAPNNVNTMAAAAIAGHNLGFDGVQGCLVSDPSLTDWHTVEVHVTGPSTGEHDRAFTVVTTRKNPAALGAVTGTATYSAFFSSLLAVHSPTLTYKRLKERAQVFTSAEPWSFLVKRFEEDNLTFPF